MDVHLAAVGPHLVGTTLAHPPRLSVPRRRPCRRERRARGRAGSSEHRAEKEMDPESART
ncbi:hypothetical protein B005_3570 [Nocardiopsis alba ATCC BAA-2165]|uniref:Uncharacterized protein n=1 Tax=Nocardiopsis alba (strain ATCC BAA-2165 / BE74) TaxID=1205910 RepID=J7L8H4_NOCAA|nr:hypothetical protein B005_3570 [Nocardiopsis alba ATCC BAA-2165]